eukprot:3938461-Rhodomonas_salina.1
MVDLDAERLVGTVRFTSPAGAAADFVVVVSAEPASAGLNNVGEEVQNPTFGGLLPSTVEPCVVASAGND